MLESTRASHVYRMYSCLFFIVDMYNERRHLFVKTRNSFGRSSIPSVRNFCYQNQFTSNYRLLTPSLNFSQLFVKHFKSTFIDIPTSDKIVLKEFRCQSWKCTLYFSYYEKQECAREHFKWETEDKLQLAFVYRQALIEQLLDVNRIQILVNSESTGWWNTCTRLLGEQSSLKMCDQHK